MDESFKDAPVPERPKRSRRSWSDDEKQRIIALALAPGASVADIARQHGLNANLLFNWVRSARGLSAVGASRQPAASAYPPAEPVAAASSFDFIPLGVFARASDGGPALLAPPEPVETPKPPSARQAPTGTAPEIQPGLIEIELTNGTRLRVDAFVNERALQRVVSVLKAVT